LTKKIMQVDDSNKLDHDKEQDKKKRKEVEKQK
jgi:hypothetical protein